MAKQGSGDKHLDCLLTNMATARYGPVRIAAAKDHYLRLVDGNVSKGMGLNDARPEAMNQMMQIIEKSGVAKRLKFEATTKKLGEHRARLDEGLAAPLSKWGRSLAARAYDVWHGTVEDVPHLKTSRQNFVAEKDAAWGNITSMFRGVLDDFSRNWAGFNRGRVETHDIANEIIRPGSTSSKPAKDIATALRKMYDYYVSEVGMNGVTLGRTVGDELAVQPNAVKLERMGLEGFKAFVKNNNIDWNSSGSGYFIRESERDAFLTSYYNAHVKEMWGENQWETNKELKGIPRPYEYTGGQFGREYQNYTLLKFKTGEAYARFHTELMDGDFLSTVTRMMEKYAHNIGMVKIWGPSPKHTALAFKTMTEDAIKTLKPAGKPISNLNRFQRRMRNIEDIVFKSNPIDGENRFGMFVQSTNNLMQSAMLNGAIIPSIVGDMTTMLANRFRNHEPLLQPLGQYLQNMFATARARRDALGIGHIHSEYSAQITHSTHYNNGFAWGETAAKYLSDKTMKLNLMNRHFDSMVTADNKWRAISLFENRHLPYDQIRERFVLENNGITPAEWDRTRKVMANNPFQPADEVSMFRPLDHMTELGSDLTHKWQRLFWNESRRSVMRSSIEAQAIAMGGSRSDEVMGALRSSTVAFQSYGITFALNLSRIIMEGTPGERLGAFARVGLTAVVAGAIAAQARNVFQGRGLEPMDTVSFWIKASSSALGPWGSLISGGLRTDPASAIIKAAGGPYVEMMGELFARTSGSAFQFFEVSEGNSEWLATKEGVKWVDFVRKYAMPGTVWSALLMQRHILEPFQQYLDPQGMRKRFQGQISRAKGTGAEYRKGVEPGSGGAFIPGL